MDSSDFSMSRPLKKELQGSRPAPLKVRKDSHKIKKPPLALQPVLQRQPAQMRPPVIIYTVSPKVIHTNPNDFMNLVQRLTGSTSSSSMSSGSSSFLPSSSTSNHPTIFNDTTTSAAISPAARFASIAKTKSSLPEGKKQQISNENFGVLEAIEMNPGVERTSFFPGILSPGPTSLPRISPNFFSPPSDPNSISTFFHDLSPVLHGNRSFMEGNFMASPSSFNISPYLIPSPTTPSIDLFNNFFDL